MGALFQALRRSESRGRRNAPKSLFSMQFYTICSTIYPQWLIWNIEYLLIDFKQNKMVWKSRGTNEAWV
jgi:hypothetical protein